MSFVKDLVNINYKTHSMYTGKYNIHFCKSGKQKNYKCRKID